MDIHQQKRDPLGIIDLNALSISDISYTYFCNYTNFSFSFDGIKYFFKSCDNIRSIYNELLAEVIANKFDIACASYDLGLYNGILGIISENFLLEGDCFYLLSEFVDDYHNNICDIMRKLSQRYTDIAVVNYLKKQLINILVFDILIANHDRHTNNLGIVETISDVSFSPVFDNELMLDYRSIFYGEYCLNIDNNFDNMNLISKILCHDDSIYKDKLISNLDLINYKNILNSFEEVEEKIHSHVNHYIKKEIISKFNSNYCELGNRLLKSKKFMKK